MRLLASSRAITSSREKFSRVLDVIDQLIIIKVRVYSKIKLILLYAFVTIILNLYHWGLS